MAQESCQNVGPSPPPTCHDGAWGASPPPSCLCPHTVCPILSAMGDRAEAHPLLLLLVPALRFLLLLESPVETNHKPGVTKGRTSGLGCSGPSPCCSYPGKDQRKDDSPHSWGQMRSPRPPRGHAGRNSKERGAGAALGLEQRNLFLLGHREDDPPRPSSDRKAAPAAARSTASQGHTSAEGKETSTMLVPAVPPPLCGAQPASPDPR